MLYSIRFYRPRSRGGLPSGRSRAVATHFDQPERNSNLIWGHLRRKLATCERYNQLGLIAQRLLNTWLSIAGV